MTSASDLSLALDEFTGICAVGALYNAGIEASTVGNFLALKITGTAYWDETELPMAVWAGGRDGTPGVPEADTWLQIGETTMSLSEPLEVESFSMVPTKALRGVVNAIGQMSAMLESATDALECAENEYDLTATIEQLKRIAGEGKLAIEHELNALTAHTDLLLNCAVDLLGNMTVTESKDVHLAFDVTAETLDPETGNKVTVRAGWAKADETSHNYTHCFELNGAKCQAHDEDALDRMLAAYPEESKEHYRHTLVHLHQAAHAVGDYAAGKVGEAIAKAGSVSEPLLHVDRHALTHQIHADVAEELNQFTLDMSGEPGRGGEAHSHHDR